MNNEFDIIVRRQVDCYLRAIQRNRNGWRGFAQRRASWPRWLLWLYWDRTPIPPPMPAPLHPRIERRARELGILPNDQDETTPVNVTVRADARTAPFTGVVSIALLGDFLSSGCW